MRTIAVLPAKRFAGAKQRLAAGIDDKRREAVVEAMLGDVLEAIGEARSIEGTIVVSDEERAAQAAVAAGAIVVADPGDGSEVRGNDSGTGANTARQAAGTASGHSLAALAGIARAVELGADCVVLLPGDCPLLEARDLDHLLTGMPDPFVAVVPDRHGPGTNALALRPPDAIRPAFGEGSRERHIAAARAAGVPYAVEELPSLALDLDTPADVVALTRELERRPGRARRTAKALGL
ncbi:MAG TPA: 2-phospho-L-lactate guanylyltransferase [Thermoanaerobaculia bacterium]|nr:2-phospho-L-lactate guanylyltransferase [Thermoanaerobaculia bacterium]